MGLIADQFADPTVWGWCERYDAFRSHRPLCLFALAIYTALSATLGVNVSTTTPASASALVLLPSSSFEYLTAVHMRRILRLNILQAAGVLSFDIQ
jgi:hypothetical protein